MLNSELIFQSVKQQNPVQNKVFEPQTINSEAQSYVSAPSLIQSSRSSLKQSESQSSYQASVNLPQTDPQIQNDKNSSLYIDYPIDLEKNHPIPPTQVRANKENEILALDTLTEHQYTYKAKPKAREVEQVDDEEYVEFRLDTVKDVRTNLQVEQKEQYSVSYQSKSVKKASNLKNKNIFYYDRIGEQKSIITTLSHVNIFQQSILPIFISFVIYIVIMIVQFQIGDYCFTEETECANYWIRLWSFFRQQLVFKLAIVICRGNIIYELIFEHNKQRKLQHRRPQMEYGLLIVISILVDFTMIFWVGFNDDWIYLIHVNVISLVVFLHTFHIKTWGKAFSKARSYLLYDIAIMCLIVYLFWGITYIYHKMYSQYDVNNSEFFMFLYPVLDLIMEILIDWTLSQTKYCQLYIYQAQLLIIGTRINVLICGDMKRFDYWWCLFWIIIMRINNITLVFTVFIRRIIYYATPDSLKWLTSMPEIGITMKGKQGASYEHLIWILIFYMFAIAKKTMVFAFRDYDVISDGTFYTSQWQLYLRWSYQPVIVWLFLLVPEFVGYKLNKSKDYDTIKYIQYPLRLYENVLIRLMGFYLFNIAILNPFT